MNNSIGKIPLNEEIDIYENIDDALQTVGILIEQEMDNDIFLVKEEIDRLEMIQDYLLKAQGLFPSEIEQVTK